MKNIIYTISSILFLASCGADGNKVCQNVEERKIEIIVSNEFDYKIIRNEIQKILLPKKCSNGNCTIYELDIRGFGSTKIINLYDYSEGKEKTLTNANNLNILEKDQREKINEIRWPKLNELGVDTSKYNLKFKKLVSTDEYLLLFSKQHETNDSTLIIFNNFKVLRDSLNEMICSNSLQSGTIAIAYLPLPVLQKTEGDNDDRSGIFNIEGISKELDEITKSAKSIDHKLLASRKIDQVLAKQLEINPNDWQLWAIRARNRSNLEDYGKLNDIKKYLNSSARAANATEESSELMSYMDLYSDYELKSFYSQRSAHLIGIKQALINQNDAFLNTPFKYMLSKYGNKQGKQINLLKNDSYEYTDAKNNFPKIRITTYDIINNTSKFDIYWPNKNGKDDKFEFELGRGETKEISPPGYERVKIINNATGNSPYFNIRLDLIEEEVNSTSNTESGKENNVSWYRDFDRDEFGDYSSVSNNPTKPLGYIGQSSSKGNDNCPGRPGNLKGCPELEIQPLNKQIVIGESNQLRAVDLGLLNDDLIIWSGDDSIRFKQTEGRSVNFTCSTVGAYMVRYRVSNSISPIGSIAEKRINVEIRKDQIEKIIKPIIIQGRSSGSGSFEARTRAAMNELFKHTLSEKIDVFDESDTYRAPLATFLTSDVKYGFPRDKYDLKITNIEYDNSNGKISKLQIKFI